MQSVLLLKDFYRSSGHGPLVPRYAAVRSKTIFSCDNCIITACQGSCVKAIFLHLSVILFAGVGRGV